MTIKTKIVFIANPNNPTGTIISKKTLLSLRKKLRNNISEGLAEIKSRGDNIPTNITTIKNFNLGENSDDFLSYGTASKNLYLIMLEKGVN